MPHNLALRILGKAFEWRRERGLGGRIFRTRSRIFPGGVGALPGYEARMAE